ncbi:MAG TPA: hypothetical protein VLD63_10150 [Anaerolineales bacterium]|nr:hypothetical protein [Anaerolineales bacterium]
MRTTRWTLILAAIFLPAVGLVTGAARPPAVPGLSLHPSFGTPGTTVSARGSDFTPGVEVSLMWDKVLAVGTGTPDADGNVTIAFRVPAQAAAGWHTVVLGQGSNKASAAFQVIPAPTATLTSTPTFTCEQVQSCTTTPTSTEGTQTASASSTSTELARASFTPSASATPSPTAKVSPADTSGGGGVGLLLLLCGGALVAASGLGLVVMLLRRGRDHTS